MTAPDFSAYAITGDQYINGRWRTGRSRRRLADRNPFNGELLLEMPLASVADMDEAYLAAERAQTNWAASHPSLRAALIESLVLVIQKRAPEIIEWLISESGSTRLKASLELTSTLNLVRECATLPMQVEGRILTSYKRDQQSFVFREPLGVIGVISTWNFPFYLGMRSVVPALALGNTVVLKPASDTAVTGGLLIAHLFEEAGFPPGSLNVLIGRGSEIGDSFVEHPVPNLIAFSGSTEVGRNVGGIANGGNHIKRVALELAGNAPLVVLDDADIEIAVHAAVVGRYLHQGQICTGVNRVIVDRNLYADFSTLLVERVRGLEVGDPSDAKTVIGPLINQCHLEGLLRKILTAKRAGLKQLCGGEASGLVLPAHVFGEVGANQALARDESLGPLLPLMVAENQAHALELANASEYGLSSSVFTQDMARGLSFARGILTRMTHINDIPFDYQPSALSGCENNSGTGHFIGTHALNEFTRSHWVTWQPGSHQYPF